jgi:hypothetical protein
MKFCLYLFLILLCSCDFNSKTVYLYSQWHLTSNIQTTNIEKSKLLPQFAHQKKLYQAVSELVSLGEIDLLVQEGCQGVIDKNFEENYYGWTMEKLYQLNKSPTFEDILVPVPMKIRAKYPQKKMTITCGESEKLIEEQNLSFSDLRGNVNFYLTLKESQKENVIKFNRFKKAFLKLIKKPRYEGNVIRLARQKAKESLTHVTQVIEKRNVYITNFMKNQSFKKSVIIIGKLHIPHLKEELQKAGFKVVLKEGTYPKNEESLLDSMKILLNENLEKPRLELFQTPQGFKLTQFPMQNIIPQNKLFTAKEWKSMQKMIQEVPVPKEVILSDYDGDGVRDFTLSRGGELIILAAEDSDWDNDGVPNLIDPRVGAVSISEEKSKIEFSNELRLQKYKGTGFEKRTGVKLLSTKGESFELLVLKIYEVLLTLYQGQTAIKFLHSTKPVIQYGKQVFFSYIPVSETIEVYTSQLMKHFRKVKNRKFKEVDEIKFIQEYATPIIVQSLAHEIGHSTKYEIDRYAKASGWTFKTTKYLGKYLKSFRHPQKVITTIDSDLKFKNKTFKDWMKEKNLFENSRSLAFRNKSTAKLSKRFLTGLKTQNLLYQMSLLFPLGAVSYYSLKNPSEWFAENFAACLFQKVFPKSVESLESLRYENLIGLSPALANNKICEDMALKRTK